VTNQLAKKVVDDRTILVYPNTPAKRRDYQDLVVKSFYVANADVKQTANLIRAILKTRDLYVDERLGLLVMRDTPEAVRMAEKLVASQDLAEPEVVLDVEVLEVGRNKLQQIGINWPNQITLTPAGAGNPATPGVLTLEEAKNLSPTQVQMTVTNPFIALNLQQADGQTNVLANPRIRVRNHEKAKIHIGDRVPVLTTTAASSGSFVSQSVSYLDIGLKLQVEPQITLDNETAIKVSLEVSNIVKEVTDASGNTLAYQIGTRNADTVLRLKDGETQILAGLISDEDRRLAAQVPGVSDLPVLGRLFSSQGVTANKSEIVLLMTPHIVRSLERPEARTTEFRSGTESEVGASGVGGRIIVPAVQPAVPPASRAPAAAPAPGVVNPPPNAVTQ
jgi:general secretion pathway protein D